MTKPNFDKSLQELLDGRIQGFSEWYINPPVTGYLVVNKRKSVIIPFIEKDVNFYNLMHRLSISYRYEGYPGVSFWLKEKTLIVGPVMWFEDLDAAFSVAKLYGEQSVWSLVEDTRILVNHV